MDERESLGSRVLALKRRLETDNLTPEDKERLELARRLRELHRDGKTLEECAHVLGQHPKMLAQFARRGVYKLFCDYLERLEHGDDEKAVERVVRKARTEFAGFSPDAIQYIRGCFRRDEQGEWSDDGKAMWATQLVAKGVGLTEPQSVVRPIININIAALKAEMSQVASDDAEADAAARAITVTPQKALA